MKALILPALFSLSLLLVISCKKEEDPDGPDACFTFPEELYAGEAIPFSSLCSHDAVAFEWTFGDGGNSMEENPSHTFPNSGTFTVTLKVTDAHDETAVITANVVIMPPQIVEHAGVISTDELWVEAVHLITGDVDVKGATLTIMPGAVIKFSANSELTIGYGSEAAGATLIAEGTMEKPITFTSAASTQSPGDWDYIAFYGGASNASSMKYCMMEYGGAYQNYGLVHVKDCKVSMENCQIRYAEYHGITVVDEGQFSSFTGNSIASVGESAILINSEYVHTIGLDNELDAPMGIQVTGRHITKSVTWHRQSTPYYILQNVNVGSNSGAVLTLEPGVEIRMGGNAALTFGYGDKPLGSLMAEGSPSDHIVITSAAATPSPGDWEYIRFYEGAGNKSVMSYCDIMYGGGYSNNLGMLILTESSLSLMNSTVSHSANLGAQLEAGSSFTACTGNTFSDNGTFPVEVRGNYAHTIQAGNDFQSGSSILVKGDKIEQSDITWLNLGVPYVIDGTMDLGSETGAKLSIEAGTTVGFTGSSEFRVGYSNGSFGILVADGAPGNEISFTSAAPSGFQSSGDWDGIWFYEGTGNGTVLDNCIISYGGGYGNSSGNINVRVEKSGVPEITNCQILHSGAWGIYLNSGADPILSGNILSGNVLGEIRNP